jgi:hypothetical protein
LVTAGAIEVSVIRTQACPSGHSPTFRLSSLFGTTLTTVDESCRENGHGPAL